ncbi:xylulokinase [Lentilitoribacter sp. Alg239-R112]|uniref:xylulokinase n=1 Tax=Lentilitoribacter sp. Alg239-R112 TaxID=2305987 RepID=UPI0013A7069A|nr:xylulokinase [Lentilitoribacter sp. Alg239-R112]
MSYLGIDLGTSGLRALLIGEDGKSIGSAEKHYNVSNPQAGWSEQNPQHWIDALDGAIGELKKQHSEFSELKGIGVAGHMHGATLLSADGAVLRPCILWNDTRSYKEAAILDALPNVRELSGNIVFPGFTAPKLEWVKNNEPDIYAKVAKVLLPAAYLNFYLTGSYVADMSDSAGTSWLDCSARVWSDELLKAGHMRRDQMPSLVEGCEVSGELKSELQQKWGLSNTVIIAGGAGDNAAAACGIGALDEGQGFVSLGTSGVILAARNAYVPDPATAVHTFCHAVPDRWYQMGVMLSATDSLNWLAGITGTKQSELTSALGDKVLPPSSVRFLPYLSGERTPHNDAEIRGGFTGLATSTNHHDMTQAVIEGVSFGLRDSLAALQSTGAKLDGLTAIGGGSASHYWLQLLATILGLPLHLPKGHEFGAALGAARLGQVTAKSIAPEDVIVAPEISQTIDPVSTLQPQFDEAYQNFRLAYSGLKAIQ